jgi:UDP-GlcNAc:undecaprenyl-phosphate GlcNAc-1-phosphate transferase
MKAFLFAFVLAAVSSAVLTPVIRRLALRVGAVSLPGGRNVNVRQIPRLGGIAIAIAFLIPLLTILPAESVVAAALRAEWKRVTGLMLGAFIMATVGVADDTRSVRALHKLGFQVAAAVIAFAAGFRIEAVSVPFFGELSMGIFALPITVGWIVGVINAINLIDGLDGLAAGIAFFAALTNFVVAYVAHDTFVAALMVTTMGSIAGFLLFNFNPARIFMGDSGSYFLGIVLGTTSVIGAAQKTSTTVSILVPMLALGVPIFDTLFSIIRRFLERRPIFSADRGHIHHRLLDMGLTHRRSVLILYGVSFVLTIAAIGVSLGRSWQVGAALTCASIVLVALVRFAGYFEYVSRIRLRRGLSTASDTEQFRRAVPEVLAELATNHDENAVLGTLAGLAASGLVLDVELAAMGGGEPFQRWSHPTEIDPAEVANVELPLGEVHNATTMLRIRWASKSGQATPESSILLQLIADATTHALKRSSSAFVRAPSHAPLAPHALAPVSSSSPLEA